MMMRYFCVFLMVLIESCVQPIDITINEPDLQELVLSGILEVSGDLPDILRLTNSTSPTSMKVLTPTIQQLSFTSNGFFEHEEEVDTNGYIKVPNAFPKEGSDYEVVVELADGRSVNVKGNAPTRAVIGQVSYGRDGTLNRYGEEVSLVTVEIDDPPGENNFYEMFVFYFNPRIAKNEKGSVVYLNQIYNPNTILTNEGDQDYLPKMMFFSDEIFDGQLIKFEQYFEGGAQSGIVSPEIDFNLEEEGIYLLVRSIDHSYYSFLKSWVRHRYTQDLGTGFGSFSDITFERLQDVIFAPEPTPLITNVTGGLGVVGAAYTQIVKLQ